MSKALAVDHVKDSFTKECNSALNLVVSIWSLPQKIKPSASVGIHPKHTQQIVELAFMGIVSSWEEFLERALVRYVAGAKTASGYAPTPKYGLANDIQHAYELLSGDPKFNQETGFLKTTNSKWVKNQGDFFFSSHPFGCLDAATQLLANATSIRNRVAHSSEKCRTEFKKAAVYFTAPPGGVLAQGAAPGRLLMSEATRNFPAATIAKKISHFQAYEELYSTLASKIVP